MGVHCWNWFLGWVSDLRAFRLCILLVFILCSGKFDSPSNNQNLQIKWKQKKSPMECFFKIISKTLYNWSVSTKHKCFISSSISCSAVIVSPTSLILLLFYLHCFPFIASKNILLVSNHFVSIFLLFLTRRQFMFSAFLHERAFQENFQHSNFWINILKVLCKWLCPQVNYFHMEVFHPFKSHTFC